jgi:PKD repeat protein
MSGNLLHTQNNTYQADTINNLSAGYYIIEVTNTACGNYIDTVEIVNPQPIQIVENILPPTCKNSNNGSIQIQTFGGNEPYSYLWSNGDTTQNITNIAATVYQLTITDVNGCSAQFNIPIQAQYPVTAAFTCSDTAWLVNNVASVMFNNESVGATAYEWDFDDGNEIEVAVHPIYNFTSEGIYNVRLKAINNSCEDIFEKEISVLENQISAVKPNDKEQFQTKAFIKDDKIIVEYIGKLNENLQINIVDNLGKNVIESIMVSDYTVSTHIPINKFAAGIYYLKLHSNQYSKTIKLTKP